MSIFSAFARLSGWTMVSRILGFGRDFLMAITIGPGFIMDVFIVALRFPNLFRRFFAEGAFNAAFVPQFNKKLTKQGKGKAEIFGNQALAMMASFVLLFSAVVIAFMPQIIPLLVPGFTANPAKLDLTIQLSRITFPYLFCMSICALLSGMLNSYGRFSATAIAPIFLNLILIAVLVVAYNDAEFMAKQHWQAYALAWGIMLSGVLQLIIMFIATQRAGFRYRLLLPRWNEDMRVLMVKILPASMSAGIMQVNLVVGDILASLLGGSAISWLYFSDRLVQLPVGVIGASVAVAALPALSHLAHMRDTTARDAQLVYGLRLVLFFTLPATVALVYMPEAIISALFGYGEFSANDIKATAYALQMAAPSIVAFSVVRILLALFFAHEDTKTPALISVGIVLLNATTAFILMQFMAHAGIALASSIAAFTNVTILWCILSKRKLCPQLDELTGFLLKCLIPLASMLALLWLMQTYMPTDSISANWRALTLIAQVAIAAIVYVSIGFLCKCVSLADLRK